MERFHEYLLSTSTPVVLPALHIPARGSHASYSTILQSTQPLQQTILVHRCTRGPFSSSILKAEAVEFVRKKQALAEKLAKERMERPMTQMDNTFHQVVSDETHTDEAPILWSISCWEILHMVDRQDLLKLYGMVVTYYENHLVAGAGFDV
ncbi:hypothetical protein Tco_0926778 [Tanacetum coccineum]|uniref:Uncharacterized protein n=1 Tax=Tanacetum coccineum TaxID=301880 RepID=A0ABQ5DH23_9ASTR